MKPCTKEELCEELKKSEWAGVELYFIATGTGGCDGPPQVQIKEPDYANGGAPKKLTEISVVEASYYYTTIGILFVETHGLRFFTARSFDGAADKSKRGYKFDDFDSLPMMASVILADLAKIYNVKEI